MISPVGKPDQVTAAAEEFRARLEVPRTNYAQAQPK